MNDKYPSLGYAVISTLNLRNQSKVGKKIFRVPAPYFKKITAFVSCVVLQRIPVICDNK